MKFKTLCAALGLALSSGLAAAVTTLNAGPYSVTYDETTLGFGAIASWGAGSFEWQLKDTILVASFGEGLQTASFALPSFTLTPNPGYTLSGLSGFLGNISYFESGPGAATSITVSATAAINGGPATAITSIAMTQHPNANGDGYFADSAAVPVNPIASFQLVSGALALSATADQPDGVAAITAQPQNVLRFSFTASLVPEPSAPALFLVGLTGLGALALRRSRARSR